MHALLNNIQRKAASQALAKRTIVLCRNKLDEKIYVDKSYKYAIKRKLRQNVTLEQVWADIKNFYEFLKFFDDFDTFITYRVLLEVHFIYTNTHKNYYYNFLLEFWNWIYNKNFAPLFLSSITHHISVSYYDQPLFAQNVLELALMLCIVFIADFFLGSLSKVFRVRKFCIGRRVIRRSAEIIISPVVVAGFYVW